MKTIRIKKEIYESIRNNNKNLAEVERGEHLQTPDGKVVEVLGKKHSEGGELIEAPDGTKVISDYVKIGAPLAKMFKKEYGLNVVAGSTFATVIDRFKKKIGLDKVLDEEVSLIKKMEDQENVENETVKNLNLEIVSDKLSELESRKQPMEEELSNFTNLVFEMQESKKQTEESKFKKQEGGEVSGIETLIQNYAQLTNTSPEEIISSLQQLSEEEVKQALQQMYEAVGASQTQMQKGGYLDKVDTSFSGNYEALKRSADSFLNGDDSALAASIVKFIDPTGATSWGDVKKAWNDGKFDKDDVIEFLGALPVFGKVGKLSKGANSLIDLTKVVNKKGYVNKFVDFLNSSTKFIDKAGVKKLDDAVKSGTKNLAEKMFGIQSNRASNSVNNYVDGLNTSNRLADSYQVVEQRFQEGGEVQQGGEDEIMQLIQAYAELNGIDPNQILEQLQNLPQEEAQQVIEQIMSEMQQGGVEQPQQDIEQLLTLFSEQNGIPLEEVIAQFEQLSEEEQQQFLKEIQEQASGGGEDLEQIILKFAEVNGVDPNEIMQQLSQLGEEELTQAVEQMKSQIS